MDKTYLNELETIAKSYISKLNNGEMKMEIKDLIKSMTAAELKAKLGSLNEDQKITLKSVLEDMNKAKAVSFDKEADKAKYTNGKIDDTIQQEETASPSDDEVLMKEEAKKQKHQGDNTPEGLEGQVIKSEEAVIDSEDMAKVEAEEEEGNERKNIDSKIDKSCDEEKEEVEKSCQKESEDMCDKELEKDQKEFKLQDDLDKESCEGSMSEEFVGDFGQDDVNKEIRKSLTSTFLETETSVEDVTELVKSFGGDICLMSDYLFAESDEAADELLKAKTVSRNGIRYYVDGKSAGKIVGSVRGDGASLKAIARAKKKGKVSAAGAKAGMKEANERKKEAKGRFDANSYGSDMSHNGPKRVGSSPGNADLKAVKNRAAKRLAGRKAGLSSKEYKERSDKRAKEHFESKTVKDSIEARKKLQYKKDGSMKNTKAAQAARAEYSEKKTKADLASKEMNMEQHKDRKDTNAAGKKKALLLNKKKKT